MGNKHLIKKVYNKRKAILGIIIGIGIIVVLTGGCLKISEWPSQITHRLNLPSTIEPTHPLIQELNAEYNESLSGIAKWLRNLKCSGYERTQRELEHLENYIEELIDYEYDYANKEHNALEHIPSVDQVLHSKEDDCDGRAIVTCSLLIARGYNSYVVINEQHAWVVTYLNDGSTIEILRENYKTPWIIKWNHYHVVVNHAHPLILAGSLLLTVILLLKIGFPILSRKLVINEL